jgi:hypothetical protein
MLQFLSIICRILLLLMAYYTTLQFALDIPVYCSKGLLEIGNDICDML